MVARIGVSRCLLGEAVRYDGRHKRDAFVSGFLLAAPGLDVVPVCPELEAGMGVPREPVVLRAQPDGGLRMAGAATGRDWTAALEAVCAARLDPASAFDGWVLKSRSPSCGLAAVPRLDPSGAEVGAGPGLFAATVASAQPGAPRVDETALATPHGRARFLAAAVRHAARRAGIGLPGEPGDGERAAAHDVALAWLPVPLARALARWEAARPA